MNRKTNATDTDFTPTLDMVLPNGKRVRDCTFGELEFYGRLYLATGAAFKQTPNGERMIVEKNAPGDLFQRSHLMELGAIKEIEDALSNRNSCAGELHVMTGDHPEWGYVVTVKDGERGYAFATRVTFR